MMCFGVYLDSVKDMLLFEEEIDMTIDSYSRYDKIICHRISIHYF